MGSLLRPTFTAPVPANAERVRVKGRPCVRFLSRGKAKTLPLSKDGTRVVKQAAKWYGQYVDADGTVRRKPLARDKEAARQLLAGIEKKVERRRSGLTDAADDHSRRPLAQHLDEYAQVLASKGDSGDLVKRTLANVAAVLTGCGFAMLGDVDVSAVARWLNAKREGGEPVMIPVGVEAFEVKDVAAILGVTTDAVADHVRRHGLSATGQGRARRIARSSVEFLVARAARGIGPAAVNHYVTSHRGFFTWLVKAMRAAANPLDTLELLNEGVDVRRARRELTAEQLATVFATARASARTFRGLTGEDRYFLYLTASATGFRANALANLTPAHFHLAGDRPLIDLPARLNKSKKVKKQPIPQATAAALAAYLAGRPRGRRCGKGAGTRTPPRYSASTWRRPPCRSWSRGRTGRCTPTSTPCGTRTSPCSVARG